MGDFVPRTDSELKSIPFYADATVAITSAIIAATSVAPFLTIVDSAVVSNTAKGGSMIRDIINASKEYPAAFRSPAVWMVAGVYSMTYAAANLSDVTAERTRADAGKAAAGKFVATTLANGGGSILKDAAFARMFGASTPGAALVVPMASYALFAARDSLTIGGAFFVPNVLASALHNVGKVDRDEAAVAAQLSTPMLMQLVCSPLHLLALNMVNVPKVDSVGERVKAVKRTVVPAFIARSLRMLPAYGVGGLLNGSLRRKGRDAVAHMYIDGHVTKETIPVLLSGRASTIMYGDMHPINLAHGWREVVHGRSVSEFMKENDLNGDGELDVKEVELLLRKQGIHHGAKELVNAADLDGSGRISPDELRAVLHRRVTCPEITNEVLHRRATKRSE